MCSVEFQTVPLCARVQGFLFCSVPLSPVAFHCIAAIIAASAADSTLPLHQRRPRIGAGSTPFACRSLDRALDPKLTWYYLRLGHSWEGISRPQFNCHVPARAEWQLGQRSGATLIPSVVLIRLLSLGGWTKIRRFPELHDWCSTSLTRHGVGAYTKGNPSELTPVAQKILLAAVDDHHGEEAGGHPLRIRSCTISANT